MKVLNVSSSYRSQMIDITRQVNDIVKEKGTKSGICVVFVPHTTAGVTINENADPDVKEDIINKLNRLIPVDDGYRHFEGNSDAHLKASIMGFSQEIIIEDGKLVLGTWQGIYFCEYDGPRERKIYIKIV